MSVSSLANGTELHQWYYIMIDRLYKARHEFFVCSPHAKHHSIFPRLVHVTSRSHAYAYAKKKTQGRRLTSLFRRRRSASNNFNQLAGNDSLSGSVEENLESVDHVAGVLGGVIHGVSTG